MSRQQHADARMRGYVGPFFPDSLDAFAAELERIGYDNLANFRSVVQGARSHTAVRKIVTSDGYEWPWAWGFNTSDGYVFVLIPGHDDQDAADGTQFDRSLAVHSVSGNEARADIVVQQLLAFVMENRRIAEATSENRS